MTDATNWFDEKKNEILFFFFQDSNNHNFNEFLPQMECKIIEENGNNLETETSTDVVAPNSN